MCVCVLGGRVRVGGGGKSCVSVCMCVFVCGV